MLHPLNHTMPLAVCAKSNKSIHISPATRVAGSFNPAYSRLPIPQTFSNFFQCLILPPHRLNVSILVTKVVQPSSQDNHSPQHLSKIHRDWPKFHKMGGASSYEDMNGRILSKGKPSLLQILSSVMKHCSIQRTCMSTM